MAGRASSKAIKSPVNLAVGALVKRIRESQHSRLEQAARLLGVAPTYLKTIENGTNALPADSVAGLKSLGIEFVAASTLLALVHYLDRRKPHTREYDFHEIQLRTDKLLSEHDAIAFHSFLTWVSAEIRSIKESANYDAIDLDEAVSLLLTALKQISMLQFREEGLLPSNTITAFQLSPIFEDFVSQFASKLALVTPYISRANFKIWEMTNASRMLEVRAYVDDVDWFLADAINFEWQAMLLNAHRPLLTIFVPRNTTTKAANLLDEFYAQLPAGRSKPKKDDVKEQIQFVKLTERTEKEMQQSLVYDFVQSKLAPKKFLEASEDKLLAEKRFIKFNNAWLYALKPEFVGAEAQNIIGVLGAYDEVSPSTFGVMMDRLAIKQWWNLTDRFIVKSGD